MSDPMLRAYKAAESMEPIVLLDYFVRIITYNEQNGIFRRVNYVEKIPPFQALDIGAIPAQTASAKARLQNLDVWDNEFAQYRWFPLDSAEFYLYLPQGVSKWQLKNLTVGMTRAVILRDPELVSTEFCQWQDQSAAIVANNFSDYALQACRIVAFGYRFHTLQLDQKTLNQLNAGQLPYTPVFCAGMGGAGR